MKKRKNKNVEIAKITVFITSIFVLFLSVSYAFITYTLEGTKRQVITAGTLRLTLHEDDDTIQLENAMPMYDEVGMIQDAFTFSLQNEGEDTVNYVLKLVDVTTEEETDKLEESKVRYGLTKQVGEEGETVKKDLISTLTKRTLDSGKITGGQTINYALRLWIDSTVTNQTEISGKSRSYRIDIEINQEIEE